MHRHRDAFVVALALALLAQTAGCGRQAAPTAPAAVSPPMADDGPAPAPAPAPATARYRVTFDATWSRTSHPQAPPDDPHFSGLIGATHGAAVSFWAPGALASPGIQRMAERGAKAPLDAEVAQAIADGHAGALLSGDGLSDSPGTVMLEFDVSQTHPLVTLVTMVAPSPDWFTGVRDLPLFLDDNWVEAVTVDLLPWDAGTDDGTTFMAADEASRPHVPVSRLTAFPFLVEGRVPPLGTFTFTRLGG